MDRRRQNVIAALALAMAILTVVLLRAVLATVFFAITVAYVAYPLQQWLRRRGLSPRLAAGTCTAVAFLAVIAILAPIAAALYFRRADLFAFLRDLPAELPIEVGEFAVTIDIEGLLATARGTATDLAVDVARALPEFALQLFLFTLLLYALLLRPTSLRSALLLPVPDGYHDVILRLHDRTRTTLYALYVLQAATAFGTFVVAWIVFALLGYDAAFVLAALSGILQFIPVVGPSILVLGLGGFALFEGQVTLAILVTVFGLVFVGFLPDALIRPRLAALTTGMPASLYFIGFTGGVLSVGVVGVIAGPLVIALFAETVGLLSPEPSTMQQQLE